MDFLRALAGERLLFDGGMGTMLHAAGIDVGDCPELLNVTSPAVVSDIHAQYAKAGAQAVETNSLGLNAVSLERHGLAQRLEELTRAAVRCAREGVGDGVFVALSVGPTGGMLAPLGDLSFERAYEAYRRQVVAGADAGADVIYIETMADIAEARIALMAAKEHTRLPVCVSYTYEGGLRMLMGGTPAGAAAISAAAGADAIATNCSGGPEQLLAVLEATRASSDLPMIVQPNAGLPSVVGGVTRFPLDARAMAPMMLPILKAGAAAIGGCCGTTPEHIALFRDAMAGFKAPPAPACDPAPTLYSQRAGIALEDARNALFEVEGDLDALYDADPDAKAVLIDLGGLVPDAVAALLEEASLIVRAPLCFKVSSDEQAEAALRRYAGIAGVAGVSEQVRKRYGALAL